MHAQDFYGWGLPVGTVAGIRIRLHWLLLAFWLFELNTLLRFTDGNGLLLERTDVLFFWVLNIGLIFLSILLHEFGHCFAARWVGGSADDVLLWPLGGLAYCSAPNLPRSQFIVAAGGPAVTLMIALVAYISFEIVAINQPALVGTHGYWISRSLLVKYQFILLAFNLLPLYPLDGGRMFHAALWGYLGRDESPGAFGRASLYTVYAARVTAVVGVLCGIFVFQSFLVAIIFVWAWMGAEGLRRQIQEGGGQDYAFGYDFSRGYVSLGDTPKRAKKRSGGFAAWLKSRKTRAHSGRQPSPEDRRRVDELLDKISREGMSSLTRAERRFLEKASKWWG